MNIRNNNLEQKGKYKKKIKFWVQNAQKQGQQLLYYKISVLEVFKELESPTMH